MKFLNSFNNFDYESFFKDKSLVYMDGKYDKKNECLKVTLMIIEDRTEYPKNEKAVNEYEKLTVKILGKDENFLNSFKRMTPVSLSISSAKVWGDYGQNLSIEGTIMPEED